MKNYKTIFITALFFAVNTVLFAQNTEVRNLSSFNEISVSEAIEAEINKGNVEKIRIKVDGISLNEVLTKVSDGKLKVHLEGGNHGNIEVKVYITFKEIEEISVSSAARIYSEQAIRAKDLEINASSAGSIKISADVDALNISSSSAAKIVINAKTNVLEISASSAGQVEVKGNATSMETRASSSAKIDASNLLAKKVDARANSGGSIQLNAVEEINASASSGGKVRYKGSPAKSNINSSSGGSVKRY